MELVQISHKLSKNISMSEIPNSNMTIVLFTLAGALKYRAVLPWVLGTVLQVGSSFAIAQKSGNDYYAPRTTTSEVQLLRNVEGYHLNPGREEFVNGRYSAALAHYEFILRYYPNHPQVLNLLSELCTKWKHPKCNPDGWFQKAIEVNPNAAPTYVTQAIHLHRKQKLEDAVKAYKHALELQPDSLNAHYNLGLAYIDLKQYDLANQHAQKSYQLGAGLPGLRVRLEKLGKWDASAKLPESRARQPVEPADADKPAAN